MKLLYFLIIIFIIYFIAKHIKVIHVNSLPENQRNELNRKAQFRSMILTVPTKDDYAYQLNTTNTNHANTTNTNHANTTNEYFDNLEITSETDNIIKPKELLFLIKSEYLNSNHKFNMANKPVTIRYPNDNTRNIDNKYIKLIIKNINEWNNLLSNNSLSVKKINLLLIKETEDEFMIQANVKMFYLNKTLHLQLFFYGNIFKTDDFINFGKNTYNLELMNIKAISKDQFDNMINTYNDSNIFMSMQSQLQYVKKINDMHKNEN